MSDFDQVELRLVGGRKHKIDLADGVDGMTGEDLVGLAAAATERPSHTIGLVSARGRRLFGDRLLADLGLRSGDVVLVYVRSEPEPPAQMPATTTADATSLTDLGLSPEMVALIDDVDAAIGGDLGDAVVPAGPPTPPKVDRSLPPEVRMLRAKESARDRVASIIETATRMVEREDDGSDEHFFFEVQNQDGSVYHIPDADRTALTLGMTLHEKGRSMLRRLDLQLALPDEAAGDSTDGGAEAEPTEEAEEALIDGFETLMVLEAACDAFEQCDPALLVAVDNYGLLNLDIAWLYFRLQDTSKLADAADRLATVEEAFARVHGPNMEHIRRLRGGACPEMPLYARLHLLQAIASFHSGNVAGARAYLERAERDLAAMRIDPDMMAGLISMGFEETEARRALRATANNADQATMYVLERREVERRRVEEERERRADAKKRRALGKTVGGQWINVSTVNGLVGSGFPEKLVVMALRQTDNNLEESLQLLTSDEGQAILSSLLTPTPTAATPFFGPTEVEAVVGQSGVTEEAATTALASAGGDVDAAVAAIAAGGGDETGNVTVDPHVPLPDTGAETAAAEAEGEVLAMLAAMDQGEATIEQVREALEAAAGDVNAAVNHVVAQLALDDDLDAASDDGSGGDGDAMGRNEWELAQDLEDDPEAFLDIDLAVEEAVLAKYRSML